MTVERKIFQGIWKPYTMYVRSTHHKFSSLFIETIFLYVVFKSESRLWQEKNRLGEEQQLFIQQKENFERERHKFMEAVCQLDREVCSYVNICGKLLS